MQEKRMRDDLISRQTAIDVLSVGKEILSRVLDEMDVVGTDREKYSWGLGLIEEYINDIKELPSAEPERKKGEWTKDCACEFCGFKPWYERDIHTLSFCPNCGAGMREEDT